jgi:ABC-2 type transport system permease protein
VVAGKVIARAVLLGVPVIIIPILAASNAAPPLLAAWTAAVVAYGLIWHGIALIVNARGWNAATNALVLAGIWLLFAIVGPATINLIIDLRYPMPSRVTAAVQARAATQEATVQGNRELGQFLQDHPTSSNVGREGMRQFAMLQAARDRQIAERLQAVETAFEQQLQRQQRLASWLSVLSPTMVAQGVLLETAGTGRTRFEHFNAAARRFQAEWKAYFEPRVLDAATLTADEVRDAPKFNYVDDTSVTGQVAVPIAGMAIAGAALVWLGFRSYRGYQL